MPRLTLLLAAVFTAALFTSRVLADAPAWPLPKGMLALAGEVNRYDAARKQVIVVVDVQYIPWEGHPGEMIGRFAKEPDPVTKRYKPVGELVGKEVTIHLPKADMRRVVPHGEPVVTSVTLEPMQWDSGALARGKWVTVYYQPPKPRTPISAEFVVNDVQ